MNRVKRTILFADLAGDAAGRAYRHNIFAYIFGRTLHFYFLLCRKQLNDMLRACGNALAAGNAFFLINYGNAVHNFNRAERAGFFAASQTKAAIRTAFRALSSQLNSHIAVIDAEIIIFFLCFFACAATFYESSHRFGGGSLDTHDRANLFRNSRAANRAGIYRSRARNDCGRTAAAAGEPAAAAVRAGQSLQHCANSGILVNLEHLARNAKASAENNANTANAQDGIYNTHWIHSCLPSFSYSLIRPEKPRNAMDIRPAVSRAMGNPSKAFGVSLSAILSRIPANSTIASAKPIAPPSAFRTA